MAEATTYKDSDVIDITAPTGGYTAGQVIQLADGRAGFVLGLVNPAAGDRVAIQVGGQVTVTKAASKVILDGGEVMWDHSANAADLPLYVTDKDFYLGRAIGDAASANTTMVVALNAPRDSAYITLQKSAFLTLPIATAGFILPGMMGGSFRAALTSTNEAQKIDLISEQAFAIASNWIFEAVMTVVATPSGAAGDVNLGVANATHATDADSITESVFIHLDNAVDILAESDDGTTEVGATDTTVNFSVGTPFHIAFDGRTPTDVQIYVNGVNVLPNSVFALGAGTGPLKALLHVEKTADAAVASVLVSKMEVRLTADVEA